MVEIEFSVMESKPGDANNLLPLLKAFENQYNIRVNLTPISWLKGWTEIAKFGIFGIGPDVSCIGMTWIGSLASMHALRPFTQQQIRALGGADAFFESSWRTGFLSKDENAWAIPWLGDALVMYYWKDWLEQANIYDTEAAFASEAALIETLEKLQKGGCAYPLALTTRNIPMILHEAANWVWNAGGSFMDENQQRVTFNSPEAIEGWKRYFSLQPFISPETLTIPSAGDLFENHQAAVHPGGPWQGLVGRYVHDGWAQRLGIASIPGPAYVGGISFVIWQYSKHYNEAFELIRFLSSQPTSIPGSPHSFELPTRREALNMPSAQTDIFHKTYLQTLQNGRSFPTIRLWGSIEDKLIAETANVWAELFANPNTNLDEYIHRHYDLLAERLNIILEN